MKTVDLFVCQIHDAKSNKYFVFNFDCSHVYDLPANIQNYLESVYTTLGKFQNAALLLRLGFPCTLI